MKAFFLSVVVAIAIAIGAYFVLDEFQEASVGAFTTQSVRL